MGDIDYGGSYVYPGKGGGGLLVTLKTLKRGKNTWGEAESNV